ncbi:hypothetical protein [Candidatus Palauibacter sp.]|uniref:hypothetical protein n=1 Tax=Candidatus Palauibacter sp. TaxID=3101350 RepID=UPI003B02B141
MPKATTVSLRPRQYPTMPVIEADENNGVTRIEIDPDRARKILQHIEADKDLKTFHHETVRALREALDFYQLVQDAAGE